MTQLASHNKFRHKLIRDSTIIVIVTLAILILSGLLGVAMVQMINHRGYEYKVSAFGKEKLQYEFKGRDLNFLVFQKPLVHISSCCIVAPTLLAPVGPWICLLYTSDAADE